MPHTRSFRQLMSRFATGITVVTTRDEDNCLQGVTISSLTSVSLDPPLVLFCLNKKSSLHPLLRRNEFFAVNILSDAQEEVSRYFTDTKNQPQPKSIWNDTHEECPLLRQTLGWMICRRTATYKGGDHSIFLGEVVKLKKNSETLTPLLHFQSRYCGIKN